MKHMPWCKGKHTRHGECTLDRTVAGVWLRVYGSPCDSVGAQVGDTEIRDVAQLDRVIAGLQELRRQMKAGDDAARCKGHKH